MLSSDKATEDKTPFDWTGFSLKETVRKFERDWIEQALEDAGGSVTRASRLLGFRHHQSLISLINGRHPDLLEVRSPVRRRGKPLIGKVKEQRKRQ